MNLRGRNINNSRYREILLFGNSLHPSLKSNLHLGKQIALNADRFLGRYPVRPGQILSKVPAKWPVAILIGFPKKRFQLADVVDQGTVAIGHEPVISVDVLSFNSPEITIDKKLFFAEVPCNGDISIILQSLDYLRFLDIEAIEKSNKFKALTGTFCAS